MLSIEKLANANIKNRAEYTQLSTELNRLEKEKQNELRMFNNEIQRFKARYSKTNFNTDSLEASNVKMYETHNPGFCFKRNGEHRVQQDLEHAPVVDFEHLHFLLFTNGEVDIEKILCLHLLSSHETDHLTPPRRPRTSSNFTKKDSPLEQLIERSKDNPKEAALAAIMPTYVLDVKNPKRTLMDERLSARLLVNEKILELIMTVITALESSNPEKVRHLIAIAEDPSNLKRIFRKQQIQDFVMALKEHSLVNSCSSFILTQPHKIKPHHLEIRTASGALEDLVTFIRSNVLQFPKPSLDILEAESREMITIEHSPIPSKSSVLTIKRPSLSRADKLDSRREITSDDVSRFRRKDINYIKKNIDSVSSYKRSIDEDESSLIKIKRRSTDRSLGKIVTEVRDRSSRRSSNSSKRSTKREQANKEEIKVHLKQTTCPACMEKWKMPLPTPKVPKLLKSNTSSPTGSTERIVFNPVIKTDSMRRISNLIEQEQYRLGAYERKYSTASTTSSQRKRKSTESSSLDLVALNVLDLEKIRHEIREKETKKKLEKFLAS